MDWLGWGEGVLALCGASRWRPRDGGPGVVIARACAFMAWSRCERRLGRAGGPNRAWSCSVVYLIKM